MSLADLPLPPELAYDDAPPLSDADLEAWEASVLALADDVSLSVEEAAATLLEAAEHPQLLVTATALTEAELRASLDLPQAPMVLPSEGATIETKPPFRIADDGCAEWAMRHLAAIDGDLAELRERAQGWTQRIQAWFDSSARPLQARRAFFDYHLSRYGAERRAETGAATVKLPSGKVATRQVQAAAKVADEAQVLAWAKGNLIGEDLEAVVKVVEKVLVRGLQAHTTVEPVPVHQRVTWTMACGHYDYLVTDHEAIADEIVTVGEVRPCPTCRVEQGMDATSPVSHVETEQVTRLAVLDSGGEEVPGAMVEDAHLSITVSPA